MLTISTAYGIMMAHFGGDDPHYGASRVITPEGENVFGGCAYRTPEGYKCVIGCLIPDDRYMLAYDEAGMVVEDIVANLWGEEATNDDSLMDFLYKAQGIHDDHAERGWPISDFLSKLTDLYLTTTRLNNLDEATRARKAAV